MKALFIVFGSIFVGIAVLGVFLPGLPTTPFLLLSAGFYARSSDRLYRRLLESPLLGKYIRSYRKHRALPRRVKLSAITTMWIMISISCYLLRHSIMLWILPGVGILGTIVMGFLIKDLKDGHDSEDGAT